METSSFSVNVMKMKGSQTHPVPAKILSLFSELTQRDATRRVKVAFILINQVTLSEKQQRAGSGELGPTASYCLTRLVRGLASSRAGAREGFFTALVQLLRRLPALSAAQLLAAAAAQLPDVRDQRQGTEHRLGRLLAAGAAVRAGRCSQPRRLAAALLADWGHRAYMAPIAATFTVELLLRVSEEEFSSEVWPEVSPLLAAGWEGCVPERLWLLLVCRRHFPGAVDSGFLKQHWGSKKVLSPKNHPGITDMIKSASACLPAIHPLAAALAELAASRPAAELAQLRAGVLEPLLAERGPAALLVLAAVQRLVPQLSTAEMVESVLSPAVVGALVQLLPKRDQRTEQAARGLGSALVSRVLAADSSPQLQLAVVGRLVQPPGSVNFDHMTGTKILAQMINGLKAEALEPFSEIALSAFQGSQADQNLTPRGRAVACDLLCRLVQHPSAPGRTPLKEKLLQRLFTAGMMRDDTMPEELAAAATRAFFRALDHPVRRLSDLTALLRALTAHQSRLLRSPSVALRSALSSEARAAWERATETLEGLPGDGGADTDVFVILLAHLSQQLFGADCDTAIDALKELHACLERQQRRRQAAGEPGWSAVAADLLLSLLSLNVHLLRSVVRSVFTLLAPQLEPETVMHVFQSLDPQFSMDGAAPEDGPEDAASENGSGGEQEDSAEEGEDSEDGWEDASSGEDEEDGSGSDEEEEEEEEENGDQLEAMRTQVKAALGDDSDDAASVDMDSVPEEHFARVDAALAAAFRAMRKDKRMKGRDKQTDEEQALMHFRIRVLDLADVYIRACPRSVAALSLLPPLTSLLSACAADGRQAPLLGRLRACLARLTAAGGRLAEGHGVTQTLLGELVTEVLSSGARLPAFSLELGGLLAAAVRLLVRTSALLGEETDQTPVIAALKTALDAFFTDRECVYPARLFSQLLSLPAWPGGWALLSPLLSAAFSAQVRLYRRTQALQLAAAGLRNGPLLAAAPEAERAAAAERLEAGLLQMVSEATSADSVRTKYLSSALEALLALRQTAGRLGLSLPPAAAALTPALTGLGERVPLGRPVRRLVTQLTGQQTRPVSAGADSSSKKAKKTAAATSAAAAVPADQTAATADSSPAAEPRRKKRRQKPGRADAGEKQEERDGSVDSGVAEVASDAEPPPRKKKRRPEAGRVAA